MTRASGRAPLAAAVAGAALVWSAGEARALNWNSEIADAAPRHVAGVESSLVIDAGGRPRIAYTELIDGTLKFARKTASSAWVLETIDSFGESGHGVSLALDAGGNAHVVYFRATDAVTLADLIYARRSCFLPDLLCGWSKTTLATGVHSPFVGGNVALTIDGAGTLHVAFVDDAHGELKYARKDSTGWSTPLSVTPVASGQVSIAADADDLPHIAFSDSTSGLQRYAHVVCFFILCGFSEETIDTGGFGVLRLDGGGQPNVGYLRGADVRFARRSCDGSGDNCGWTSEPVASAGTGAGPSLAISASGAVHMSFYRTNLGEVDHARRGATGLWSVERVDVLGSSFGVTSMALDASGNPNVSYHDHFNDDLRFARGSPRVIFPPPIFDPPGGGVLAP